MSILNNPEAYVIVRFNDRREPVAVFPGTVYVDLDGAKLLLAVNAKQRWFIQRLSDEKIRVPEAAGHWLTIEEYFAIWWKEAG